MTTHKSYKVGRDGVILGVFDEPEMVYMVSCGKVLGSDDYWTEGMSTWAKVSSRAVWTVSTFSESPSPKLGSESVDSFAVEREVRAAVQEHERSQLSQGARGRAKQVSFFSIWWKTTLVIYVACAALGYLNSGEYGFGYMLGQGLITAPLSALLFGGVIFAFSKNSGSAGRSSDHAKVIREFDRSRVLKK